MVLEEIIKLRGVRKHPFMTFILSIILVTAGIWLSYYTFPDSSSVLALAFVTIGLMPLIHKLFIDIGKEEAQAPGWCGSFIARHFDAIKIYAWFFIGLIVAYSFWYVALPEVTPGYCATDSLQLECMMPERSVIFAEQEKTWAAISGMTQNISGKLTGVGPEACLSADKEVWGCTQFIFSNNSLVLGLAILFSFIYGAGAIFLLSWNASVIGLFLGKEILDKSLAHGFARAVGYLPHGIPEVAGYFIGAIAGAIISVAISQRKFMTHHFENIAKDAIVLMVLAYAVLFVAAFIEATLIVGAI